MVKINQNFYKLINIELQLNDNNISLFFFFPNHLQSLYTHSQGEYKKCEIYFLPHEIIIYGIISKYQKKIPKKLHQY